MKFYFIYFYLLKSNLSITEIMQLLNEKSLKENMPPFIGNPNILPSRQDTLIIAKWSDPENKLKIFSTYYYFFFSKFLWLNFLMIFILDALLL